MRQLVLMRGCPAVGKSTFLKENGLEQYTICPDIIRLMFQTPVSDCEGKESISQKNDGKVWDFVFQLVEQRMARGEFTIIDATHSRSSLIQRYRKLCQKYRYRCVVVDFEKDLELILEQNNKRDKYKIVPEEVIRKIHERLKSDKVPSWVKVIKPEEYKSIENILFDFTGKYEKIVSIGDIHGCFNPLKEYFDKNPFNEKTFYVFIGDFFDRGLQNAEVFKFVHALMQNKNVLCLTGNHENHLHDYVHGEECKICKGTGISLSFKPKEGEPLCEGEVIETPCNECRGSGVIGVKSRPFGKSIREMKKAEIPLNDIKDFYNRLGQLAYFKFEGKKYIFTHGGIPKLPSIYTATQDYVNGIGKYEESDLVDNAFCKNTDEDTYSIHGHRNVFDEPIINTPRTFNLCDKIEFGKYLRILEITKEGYTPILIKNDLFDETLINKQKPSNKEFLKSTTNEIITLLNKDRDVVKRDLGNDIYSYNFTHGVFRKKKWNDNTVKARGLFIDVKNECIVARSYDKFFNWGEREETESKSLKESLKFPVYGFKKYNGFLGILSFYAGQWFIASKSTNDGEFSEYFKNIVKRHLTNELKQYILDNNVSLVFEVIDHINDPHIIEYNESFVVLLDVIKNEFKFECLDYGSLVKFGKEHNLKVKELDFEFDNWDVMYKFKKDQDGKSRLEPNIEGWVFKDSEGFQVKYKTTFYSFWKSFRGLKDYLIKKGGDNTEVRQRLHSLDDFTVYNKMIEIPFEELKTIDIIKVRNKVMEKL